MNKKKIKTRGILINFEGIDGCGKKTQSKLLEKELRGKRCRVAAYSYPNYGSDYGKIIRAFLDGKISLSIDEQFLLYLLDMIKDKERVKQELKKGYIVIMDRYFLSAIAYQCANHFDYEIAKKMIKLMGLPKPSVVFYLEIPVDVALSRKRKQKGIGDRFEEDILYLKKVKKFYERLIGENFCSTHWIKLDGTNKRELIQDKILLKVNEWIK